MPDRTPAPASRTTAALTALTLASLPCMLITGPIGLAVTVPLGVLALLSWLDRPKA